MFTVIRKHLIFGTIFVLALVFLAGITPALRPSIVSLLKYPLIAANLTLREFKGLFFYHSNYLQNEKLKKEIDLSKQKINLLSQIYLENKRLHDLLSLKEKAPYAVVASKVIAWAVDDWGAAVVIDKGTRQGIKRGMVVINAQGLVGRVMESAQSSSKVILLTDANFSVTVLSRRSRQEGLISGTMGNFLVMRYLPKESDIRAADTIVTSGTSEIFPKDLTVGTVVDIAEEFSGLSRYCLIKPAVNFSDLEEVLVIIP